MMGKLGKWNGGFGGKVRRGSWKKCDEGIIGFGRKVKIIFLGNGDFGEG